MTVIKIKSSSKIEVKKKQERLYSTGKRKNAIARVWITSGSGKIIVNNKLMHDYFQREVLKNFVLQPFSLTNTVNQYDVFCTVKGGGCSGQAGAISHGVTKALNLLNSDFHKTLRKSGLLTRDSRVVERKKYGRHKARKSTQFSKR